MSHVNVVRAWKDEEYRLGLSDAERARLPENPAGLLDQTEAELERAVGGDVIFNTVYGCLYVPTNFTLTFPQPSIACSVQTIGVQTINQFTFGGLR
jgi:mersacidin/lichenicidin family type 2 lantibiotic